MAQTPAQLVDHVMPHVPVRQLLAAQPKLVTPVLQVMHRVITRHLLCQAGLKSEETVSGTVNAQQFSATFKDQSHASKVVFGVQGQEKRGI